MIGVARGPLNRLRIARFERLENRCVLSADTALGQLAAAAHGGDATQPKAAGQQFEISIVGTQVSYSPLGLPSDMKGTVYLDTAQGTSVASIGTYDETLQPIFAPVGPDGSLAFVGATGVCTFDFNLSVGGLGRSVTLGSIVANDTAYIEGALPNGTILVGSHNSPITASSGICAGVTGTFDGQSDVIMGATFSMHTTVDFTVHTEHDLDINETLTGLAIANSSVGQGYVDQHWEKSLTHDDDGSPHAALSHLDSLADRYAAVDSVFATENASWGGPSIPS